MNSYIYYADQLNIACQYYANVLFEDVSCGFTEDIMDKEIIIPDPYTIPDSVKEKYYQKGIKLVPEHRENS